VSYRVLADITVAVHFLWIVFLILGGIWGRRHRAVRVLHVAGLGLAAALAVSGWYCPLTYLEVWLRGRQAPGAGYGGSFIIHYVEKLIYIDVSPAVLSALTVLLIAGNVWLYLRAAFRKKATARRRP
jgi:hypothetical protein